MVELVQVDADDARLGRLLQLYMHEWSALLPASIGEDALFVYDELPDYRDRASRAAFLFLGDQRRPLGFALVRRDDGGRWHVEEFFVVAGARRAGVGDAAARAMFSTRPGPWTFTVRPENASALDFWRATVAGADEQLEPGLDGVTRTRLSFVIR